ncbi:three-Cys-motif partner protein TcmP [Rhizobium sp. WYCCWR 11146]|uniref:three-Cys-motif partner protein TcmP n=1 Tax=Rhizobium sp. WYCCWR 11146 TaxID=2749833 RepID=UPI0015E78EE8|nr:three-Cys-motif partner protein TcmP [Rhizobium sp. WYCCWR 11146]
MVRKLYDWKGGAQLDEHSKRKHKILHEYVLQYIVVRCKHPHQPRFRFAIVDGFAGAGRYAGGSPGSPLIFIDRVKAAAEAINLSRAVEGLPHINLECHLILNDADSSVTSLLMQNVAPILAEVRETSKNLQIEVSFLNEPFESAYPKIKAILTSAKITNALFNLDQCGHSYVERSTILDIINTYQSEIFYTFSIQSFLAFLSRTDPNLLLSQLSFLNLPIREIEQLNFPMSNERWLGTAERLVFDAFQVCAPFVSPFSIHNPDGWRYWFIHFAKSYRARQVYNNVLHDNSSAQAHFGRAGLNMLSYNSRDAEGHLYLFDEPGRTTAVDQLRDDIPRLLSKKGEALNVLDFYDGIYNLTPAHSADILSSLVGHPDLRVTTKSGGERRKANNIKVTDTIRLNPQQTFHRVLLPAGIR